jgi:hypothetical protein
MNHISQPNKTEDIADDPVVESMLPDFSELLSNVLKSRSQADHLQSLDAALKISSPKHSSSAIFSKRKELSETPPTTFDLDFTPLAAAANPDITSTDPASDATRTPEPGNLNAHPLPQLRTEADLGSLDAAVPMGAKREHPIPVPPAVPAAAQAFVPVSSQLEHQESPPPPAGVSVSGSTSPGAIAFSRASSNHLQPAGDTVARSTQLPTGRASSPAPPDRQHGADLPGPEDAPRSWSSLLSRAPSGGSGAPDAQDAAAPATPKHRSPVRSMALLAAWRSDGGKKLDESEGHGSSMTTRRLARHSRLAKSGQWRALWGLPVATRPERGAQSNQNSTAKVSCRYGKCADPPAPLPGSQPTPHFPGPRCSPKKCK